MRIISLPGASFLRPQRIPAEPITPHGELCSRRSGRRALCLAKGRCVGGSESRGIRLRKIRLDHGSRWQPHRALGTPAKETEEISLPLEFFGNIWCGREDTNLHGIATASPSSR